MVLRADVNPELISWARERSGAEERDLLRRFPKLDEWERGDRAPTLNQLETFARATRTPVGLLFLDEPPEEQIPIPDYRTIGDEHMARPSPDLLDTIYRCQQGQEWFRSFARVNDEQPATFIGELTTETSAVDAARTIREALGFGTGERGSTFADAIRTLTERAETMGVLVMISGIVGSNTHRKLDPQEFRGFALVDALAPLVFVNGADTKGAQLFTLIHELAHLWLGETALSDADLTVRPSVDSERWCNQVAAEVLAPLQQLQREFDRGADLTEELDRLRRVFKASTLVILRRIHDAGFLSWDDHRTAYAAELDRVFGLMEQSRGSGGNFYNTQPVRVGKRFARAVIADTLEGRTLYTEAFQMLGFRKLSTFNELARHLEVVA